MFRSSVPTALFTDAWFDELLLNVVLISSFFSFPFGFAFLYRMSDRSCTTFATLIRPNRDLHVRWPSIVTPQGCYSVSSVVSISSPAVSSPKERELVFACQYRYVPNPFRCVCHTQHTYTHILLM